MDLNILPPSFFKRKNTKLIARELLGKFLVSNINGEGLTGGMIIETEAYLGEKDMASHAYGGRKTKRVEALYMEGGTAYVHMCYGIHTMFNVSTGRAGVPEGVLIRGIKPVLGIEIMEQRRGFPFRKNLASGPGNLTKALGIAIKHNKIKLCAPALPKAFHDVSREIFIADAGIKVPETEIVQTPRIGVSYAGEWAVEPLRFCVPVFNS